jgi:hypothetical protein
MLIDDTEFEFVEDDVWRRRWMGFGWEGCVFGDSALALYRLCCFRLYRTLFQFARDDFLVFFVVEETLVSIAAIRYTGREYPSIPTHREIPVTSPNLGSFLIFERF